MLKRGEAIVRRNTVSGQTSVVPSETVPDQADNTFINGTVQIKWLGDGDDKVGFEDLFTLAQFTR